ncbi:RdgB/HAM1 family non-canonical purine NTP pyrophosphatase [Alloyangia pacifica]|uniref:RdgB/HAM1 family non-canonical purine NTP pyrophosphatase n=1 Tax=Alloyangia pacifica TaxID=311180 RepID=UPI001CD6C3AE|nr:RdgB/HAM1 family non-canonical purine NTP pyrophosphatase [Alloyangia pacifica]MCA0995379.1 RdgB/HAM1 family non-canonical purine NTP pyrophosphatase [Alloyangia pacifica]
MTRKFTDKKLLVATHNAGKLEEITDLLKPFGIEVVGAKELDLPEPEETGTTFVENARIKAHAAAKATGLPALADDSGISVDALAGAPGVYTADWAETGKGRDFIMAMGKTHDALRQTGAEQPWTARFNCTLVLAWPDGTDAVFPGVMEGRVVWPMRGDNGHGYDPIFQPEGYEITFAEMDSDEKNRISHRADAFAKFVKGCFAQDDA